MSEVKSDADFNLTLARLRARESRAKYNEQDNGGQREKLLQHLILPLVKIVRELTGIPLDLHL
ncbi:MAG: hypothetical protein ABR577_11370 [Pyrinomonadaceae bacterium]